MPPQEDIRLVDIIAGARPNFMKIAPIIRAIDARRACGSRLGWRLVHTGQHYDARMSADFFEQLNIPAAAREPRGRFRHAGRADGGHHGALRATAAEGAQPVVSGGRRRHVDDGLRHRGAEALHPCGACRSRHSLRRLDDARRDQSHGDRRDHQLLLHHQRSRQPEPAACRRAGEPHLLRRQHDDRHAVGESGRASGHRSSGISSSCRRASTWS